MPIQLPPEQLAGLSQQSLEMYWKDHALQLSSSQRSQHVATVQELLERNFTKGRWLQVMKKEFPLRDFDAAIQAYANRVAAGYEEQHTRVEPLQRGEAKAWTTLRCHLEKCARSRLQRQFYLEGRNLQYEVEELVQDTCEAVLTTYFPYDVIFEAWVSCILHNLIRHHYRAAEIRHCITFADMMAETLSPGDSNTGEEEWEFPDPCQSLESWELHNLFEDLIAQLPTEEQRQVIRLTYIFGWDAEAIATQMGKTRQAVYNLRNRGLTNLQCLLSASPGLLDN